MIRPITSQDILWVVSLGTQRYSGEYDAVGGLGALAMAISLPTALAIRSDHGFLVANILTSLWRPKRRECHVLAICVEEGHHWEAVKLLRASIEWAQEQRCTRWLVSSDTDHPVAQLAYRVGATPAGFYGVDL